MKSSACLGAEVLMKLLGNYCRNIDVKTSITVGVVGKCTIDCVLNLLALISLFLYHQICNFHATPLHVCYKCYIFATCMDLEHLPYMLHAQQMHATCNPTGPSRHVYVVCSIAEYLDTPTVCRTVIHNDLPNYFSP